MASALLDEFIQETTETLDKISQVLVNLESDSSSDRINELYRDVHSIKGNAYLFGLQNIGKLSNALESCLDPIRSKHFSLGSHFIDQFEGMIDFIRENIDSLKKTEQEISESKKIDQAITELVILILREISADIRITKDCIPVYGLQYEYKVLGKNSFSSKKIHYSSSDKNGAFIDHQAQNVKPEHKMPVREFLKSDGHHDGNSDESLITSSIEKIKEDEQHMTATSTNEQDGQKVEYDNSESVERQRFESEPKLDIKGQSENLRVSVLILDKLMNRVSELVLIRNQVLQYTNKKNDSELSNLSQRLNVVTGELQDDVMKTRMQPIGTILTKFHRVVRGLSKDLGKQVELLIEGAETELDKALLEAVKDPLTHIVRNSIDHGIESPEIRQEQGKNPQGTLLICSYHEGGQVIVEIKDDGAGLDKEIIGTKARERNIISQEKLERLSEREVLELIFLPGFSTKKQVTNVSGRGVGMDVVRTNIEHLGGLVDIASVLGKGTTIRLKIPLTLAIVPALIIRSGGERFAIPQDKLVELVRIEKNSSSKSKQEIEYLQGKPVYRLRGDLLPLIKLSEVLNINLSIDSSENAHPVEKQISENQNTTNIIVLSADSRTFGLIVDEIVDSSDIVVKPLCLFLKSLGVYSGATVLGDGSVSLTLDVLGMSNRVFLYSTDFESGSTLSQGDYRETYSYDREEFLLFGIGDENRFAIPLKEVKRLEEFDKKDIEISANQKVIRYRDMILPLLSVAKTLNLGPKNEGKGQKIPVIVVEKSGRYFGLQVETIIDIVNLCTAIDPDLNNRKGILGSMIYDESVIILINSRELIGIFSKKSTDSAIEGSNEKKDQFRKVKGKRILLIDDSPLYRKLVGETLTEIGFDVSVAEDGKHGWDLLNEENNGYNYDLIVSDIEMPRINGIELAKKVRSVERYQTLPMIALTTKMVSKDVKDGMDAGFNYYLEKLDTSELEKVVESCLGEKSMN